MSGQESWKSRAAAFLGVVQVVSHTVLCCLMVTGLFPPYPWLLPVLLLLWFHKH